MRWMSISWREHHPFRAFRSGAHAVSVSVVSRMRIAWAVAFFCDSSFLTLTLPRSIPAAPPACRARGGARRLAAPSRRRASGSWQTCLRAPRRSSCARPATFAARTSSGTRARRWCRYSYGRIRRGSLSRAFSSPGRACGLPPGSVLVQDSHRSPDCLKQLDRTQHVSGPVVAQCH